MKKTIIAALAASALSLAAVAGASNILDVSKIDGANATHIECADIVFGTGSYAESDVPDMDSFISSGIDISSVESTKAYAGSYGSALRLGSSSNAGSITFNFGRSYAISKARVYCYLWKSNEASEFTVTTDASGDPVYQSLGNWTEAPDISGVEGENSLVFSFLDGGEGLLTDSLSISQGKQGRALICKIVLTIVAEGNAPSASSSSSEEIPSSSESTSLDSSTSHDGGGESALDSELAALSPSVRDYYSDVDLSLVGSSLMADFSSCIYPHVNVGYNGLWSVYEDSDNDDGCYWDIYSDVRHCLGTGTGGNYKKEGDMVNREHIVPQSVFGEKSPMVADAHHVLPTDGYVNGRRSNYPFAEVGRATYTSNNGSKLGPSSTPGYSGTVFEPVDEYKGDIARINFYFVTCYRSTMASGWGSYAMFDYSSPLRLSSWAIDMLLKWAEEDPVSEKEIERNEGIYLHQENRNPFVDFPSLAEAIFA